jgi:hypothetical protein
MPDARKRPCCICRRWFRPDNRVGDRQRACGKPECQAARQKKDQTDWRQRHPEYARTYRMDERTTARPPKPLRLPAPLDQLPWEAEKKQFSPEGIDFIGLTATLLLQTAKKQFMAYLVDLTGLPSRLPSLAAKKQSPEARILVPIGDHGDATGISPTRPAL